MQRWTVGDVTITQIIESTYEGLEDLLPDATAAAVLPIEWLKPHYITPSGSLKYSIHALVVDTPSRRIIVDTCVGNGKPRAFFPMWDRLQTAFLEDLAAAGFPRESIDVVLCTHLHLDHVGWNTMLVDGQWVPTFPHARYLVERAEFALMDTLDADTRVEPWLREVNAVVMCDSVRPVHDAGLMDLVDGDHRVCDEVRLLPTPGHTVGHVSVVIESRGERALITGDAIHHPCQLVHPEWCVIGEFDRERSERTRREVFGGLAGSPTLVIGTHWCEPSAGRITAEGGAFRLVC
jgi:glyoxylase-like metal-dependent hydrolase (beta-lactamase superfamily II)